MTNTSKKVILILASFLIIFVLGYIFIGHLFDFLGEKIREDFDSIRPEMYDMGMDILNITDNYLNGNISRSEAYEKNEILYKNIENIYTNKINEILLRSECNTLSYSSYNSFVFDARNRLAKILSQPEREE